MLKKKIFSLSLIIFLIYGLIALRYQSTAVDTLMSYEVRQDALRNLKTAVGLINNEMLALEQLTTDYANWDDAYNFVLSKDPAFISSTLNSATLNNLNIRAVAVYNVTGELVHGDLVGAKKTTDALKTLIWQSELNPTNYLQHGKTGFFKIQNQIFMFSAQPIRDSAITRPSRGVLIFARPAEVYLIDKMTPWFRYPPEFVNNCSTTVSHTEPLKALFAAATLSFAPSQAELEGDVKIDDRQNTSLQVYYAIKNFNGRCIGYLRMYEDNGLVAKGQRMIAFAGLLTLITGLLVAFVFSILFNKNFVRPLEILKSSMTTFKNNPPAEGSENLSSNLTRKDEVGDLTRGFVEMKTSVLDAYDYMQNINHVLEEKVTERTLELKEANNGLLLSDAIIRNSTEGVMICDADRKIIRVNSAFCEMAGFSEEELIGNNPRLLKSYRHGEAFYKAMWEKILATGSWSGEIWDRKKNGEVYPKWLSISVIRDESGNISHYTSISSDITRIKEAEEQLKTLAFYDSLTGLPNRALFIDRLSQTIRNADRYETKFAVFFMDLDGFKLVNDNFGHNIGDELLILVGKRLSERVRKSDTVARLGGDEFTIILHPIAWELNLSAIAEKIIATVEEPYEIGGQKIKIGLSIGIAIVPDDDDTLEGIIRKADSAMYLSKSKGRGCYSFASEDLGLSPPKTEI